jgi:hypothetical protein
MNPIRTDVWDALTRWREVILAAGAVVMGAWVMLRGGPFYVVAGAAVALAGLALGINAARRVRFRSATLAPGVVQIVEGQIAYFGPEEGGFAALEEIEQLALDDCAAGRCWVLSLSDGRVLEVPQAARGAEALFDAFATLPGIEMSALMAALDRPRPGARVVWRRRPRPALT